MSLLGWMGLIVGGFVLGPLLLLLVRPVLRGVGIIPPGKAAPPSPVGGVFALVLLLVLILLARMFGIALVLMWVWAIAIIGLLLVVILGFLNRPVQRKRA